MIDLGKTELAGLEGTYRIIDLLDESPVGTIYLAIEREFSEQVLIKALPASGSEARTEFAKRFSREAKILQTLDSPYVPRVRDWGADQGLIFIVTEHAPGKTLLKLLQEAPQGHLETKQTLDLARKIGLALEAIHAHGIVHRDIKPRNILVTREGQVKLTNFGLAEHLDTDRLAEGDGRTLAYLAPEQSDASRAVDIRADLYAAGAVLYEMLAGRPPFEAANNIQLVMKILTSAPPPLYRMRPDLPLSVHRVVEKSLAKKVEERYQTPREFVEAIEQITLDDAAVAVIPTPKAKVDTPSEGLAMAFMLSAANKKYKIPQARSLIGRRNRTTGETPDIDLGDEADGDTVSRKHAIIVRDSDNNAWSLEVHPGHKNIVKINGHKIESDSLALHDGDDIQLGAIHLTFKTG